MSYKQIIIIPGIMGSELQYHKYTVWPPHVKVWLNKANVLEYHLGDVQSNKIKAVDYYKKYYDELYKYAQSLGEKVTPFYYDWRKNNFDHLERLSKVIDINADEVIIVAHSMGGIISKLFLTTDEYEYKANKVSKLITLGTPWNGAAESYANLLFGVGVQFIRGVFKATIPKFESIYQLLPNKFYVDNNTVNFGNGYLDNKDWIDVYKEYYTPILKSNGFTPEEVLDKFYECMNKPLPQWIEHHEIIGYKLPTLTSIKHDDFKVQGKYGNGDKTVPLHSAISETEYKYFIKEKHKKLPKNKDVKKMLSLLIKDNKSYDEIIYETGIKTLEDINAEEFSFKILRVACPVNVSLLNENGDTIYGDMSEMKTDNLLDMMLEGDDDVIYLDDDVYFVLDDKNMKKLHVEAYDKGAVSISIDEYNNNSVGITRKFKTFNMDESKSAEIIIEQDINKCKVGLESEDSNVEDIESVIIDEGVNVQPSELPKTEYKVCGERIKNIKDNIYVSDKSVYLKIDNVVKGTYDLMSTYYSVNGSNKMTINKDDKVLLSLQEGRNEIRIYSTDVYDNMEKVNLVDIYFISNSEDRIPKINIKFNPDNYTITTEAKHHKDFDKLELPEPQVTFNIEGKEDVVGNSIVYNNKNRKIIVEVEDILGKINSSDIYINELVLSLIVNSKASQKDCEVFLDYLGIKDELKSYKSTINSKVTPYKKLSTQRIVDADILEFKTNNMDIVIDKMRQYEVMFSNLREYIKLSEEEKYSFEFSVFSGSITRYTGEDIDITLAIESDNDDREYKEISKIEYKIEDEKYIFTLSSSEVNKILLESDESSINNRALFILIKLNGDRGSVLRAYELNLI